MPSGNREGALQMGEWIVNPSLDSISKGGELKSSSRARCACYCAWPAPPAKWSASIGC